MRICDFCGKPIPENELFCPGCGQEVQLVPDYETMESQFQEREKHLEEEERIRLEERAAREEMERESRRRKTRLAMIIGIAAAAAVVVILISVLVIGGRGRNASGDAQLITAEEAYQRGDLDESLRLTSEILKSRPRDPEAKYLLARIYYDMGRSDEAIETLSELLNEHTDHAQGAELLIRLYMERDDGAAIQEVLKKVKEDALRKKYAEYLPPPPEFSLPAGTYTEEDSVAIHLISGEGRIYYTLDGSEPTEDSFVYTDPIQLKEGSTTICAFAVMKNKASTDMVSATYKVELNAADAPRISPASGRYTQNVSKDQSGEDIEREETKKITVTVPSGYTCYYAFDKRPTENSSVYKDPVDMPLGEHTFYAVLMDKDGKLGKVGSATYVYREIVTTPTPTPTPNPTLTPTSVPTPTAAPTPPPTVYVTGITLNKDTLYLGINELEQLAASVNPENASDKAVKWSTSDDSIATVDKFGTVTAIAAGTATITAAANDGSGVTAVCQVFVGNG